MLKQLERTRNVIKNLFEQQLGDLSIKALRTLNGSRLNFNPVPGNIRSGEKQPSKMHPENLKLEEIEAAHISQIKSVRLK